MRRWSSDKERKRDGVGAYEKLLWKNNHWKFIIISFDWFENATKSDSFAIKLGFFYSVARTVKRGNYLEINSSKKYEKNRNETSEKKRIIWFVCIFFVLYLRWCDHVSVCVISPIFSFCCCCCFPRRKIIKVELCGANLISLFVCAIQFGCSLFSTLNKCNISTSAQYTYQTALDFQNRCISKLFIYFKAFSTDVIVECLSHSLRSEMAICNCSRSPCVLNCIRYNMNLFSADGVWQKRIPNKRANKRKSEQHNNRHLTRR